MIHLNSSVDWSNLTWEKKEQKIHANQHEMDWKTRINFVDFEFSIFADNALRIGSVGVMNTENFSSRHCLMLLHDIAIVQIIEIRRERHFTALSVNKHTIQYASVILA